MWPFNKKQPRNSDLLQARRDRDEAIATAEAMDRVAAKYKRMYETVLSERDLLQARLDALTPARDPVTKRFVGKAVSNG